MEHKINSKTTKAQLIEMMSDDQLMIEAQAADIEALKKEIAALKDEVEKSKDVTYNLRLYLTYVKKQAKELWKTMEERFSGLPGYISVRVRKAVKECEKK